MEIRKVAIIGAGVMGSGITFVITNSGFTVSLWSRRGENGLTRLVQKVEKEMIAGNQQTTRRIAIVPRKLRVIIE